MKRLPALAALVVGIMLASVVSHAADAKMGAKSAKPTMSKYLVISPHTEEECMQTLDNVKAMGPSALAKWDFGCMDGDHTGYMTVMAANSDDALKNVPESVRGKARAVKLHKFSAAELKAIHEKKS